MTSQNKTEFKRGDIVMYVGRSEEYSEPERIGSLGYVHAPFPTPNNFTGCVHVVWYAPLSIGKGCHPFPENIEVVGYVEPE